MAPAKKKAYRQRTDKVIIIPRYYVQLCHIINTHQYFKRYNHKSFNVSVVVCRHTFVYYDAL